MSSIGDTRQIVPVPEMPLAQGGIGEFGAPAAEAGFNVSEVWRVLKQRKLTVLVTFVILYALVIAVTLAVWRWWPAYPATAYLQLKAPAEHVLEPGDRLVDPKVMEMMVTTEARKISQVDVLMDVLSQKDVQSTAF